MFNWKKKIDDQEETEKRDRERHEAEAKVRQVAEQKILEEKSHRERESKILQIGQDFQCHVCKKPSILPFEREHHKGLDPDDYLNIHPSTETIWSIPGDLWQCKKCNKWTCADHLHKGICQICAEKM